MISLHLHVLAAQRVDTVRHSCRPHTVADENHALLSHERKSSPHRRRVNVHAVADDLRHHMRAVRCRADHSRRPVRKRRHGIIHVNQMICSRIKGSLCRIIIRIGMCQRDRNLSMDISDKLLCLLSGHLFRSETDELHQPIGRFLKSSADIRVTREDILRVLRSLFYRADKRTFHVDAKEVCQRRGRCPFCRTQRSIRFVRRILFHLFLLRFKSSAVMKNPDQLFHRQRHGRRSDGGHADGRLVAGDLLHGLSRPVAEIISLAPVKMQIDHSGETIASLPVHLLILCRDDLLRNFAAGKDLFDPVSPHKNCSRNKLLFFRKYVDIIDKHCNLHYFYTI